MKTKKIEYIIIRKMCDTQDSVRYYEREDKFNNLKTARNYLKDLLEALNAPNKLFNNRERLNAVSKCLNKYGFSGAYETEGVNNEIKKKIIIENIKIIVGI